MIRAESWAERCHALIELARASKSPALDLIARDLEWSLMKVPENARAPLLSLVGSLTLPATQRARMIGVVERTVLTVNVAMLVAKKRELVGAKAALGIPADREFDLEIEGYRGWTNSFKASHSRILDLTLFFVAGEGSDYMQNAVRTLAEYQRYSLFCMAGMAAGVRDLTRLGDVVLADTAIEYGKVRDTPDGPLFRAPHRRIPRRTERDLHYFLSRGRERFDGFDNALQDLREQKRLPNDVADNAWLPKLIPGAVASGLPLKADGSIPQLRKDQSERIRIVEMEAAGLVAACEEINSAWLVGKGVADFGDPRSKDRSDTGEKDRKIWQYVASAAAASTLLNLIRLDLKLK